ncbi:MAG: hypothetical protein EAZ53_04280 [Bacteroidetes bacterium]|nr:MAG: hypothetical protein EAZ53_04280 [Bacteroidota bacterium]
MKHKTSFIDFFNFLTSNHFFSTDEFIFENIAFKIRVVYQKIDSQIFDNKQDNYRYIIIWEDQWVEKYEIIKARILTLLGKNETVFARKTFLKRIDKKTAEDFFLVNHLNGYANAYYKFGLYYKGDLVSVLCLSKARNMKYELEPFLSYEIVRFASKSGINVVGGLSKLFQHFVKEFDVVHVMTYTDFDWGFPQGFVKIGFEVEKIVPQHTFYIHKNTFERINEKKSLILDDSNYYQISACKNYRLVWRK